VAIKPMTGGQRFVTAAVIGLAVALAMALLNRSITARSVPVFSVDDLAAQSPAPIDREVIVTGTWTVTWPTKEGHLRVVLCGHKGRADCHFEFAAADRSRLERRLVVASDVAIRGRCERVSAGVAVLRDCQLLDSPPSTE